MNPETAVGSLKKNILVLSIILIIVFLIPWSFAATVQQITSFGNNPTNLKMYMYVPSNVKVHPPILVVLHACHGKAADLTNSDWTTQAGKYGCINIYPDNPLSKDSCWDVHSTASLSHTGAGDPAGIVSMVRYVVQHNNGDSTRVYVAGHSSGAMMTNVMLGSYPDVFKAGAAFAGVPFGCFAAGSVDSYGWCSACANGQITKTAAQWGDIVRAAFPTFVGPRPKMQLWHGTNDDILKIANFTEEIKQWTNVLGVSDTAATTENNTFQSGWVRTRYKNTAGTIMVEAIKEANQPHNLTVMADQAALFFGLDKATDIDNRGNYIVNNKSTVPEINVLRSEPSGSLRFMVNSVPGYLDLRLYNLRGEKLATIADHVASKGMQEFSWNAGVGAGVYVVRVTVNGVFAGSHRFALCAN